MKITQQELDYTIYKVSELCKIPSPSGFTHKIVEHLINIFKEMEYDVKTSIKNSVIVDLGGSGSPLVLAAHVDTLGAMVRSIKSNGRLRLTKIGGFPENNIEAENCIIHTRKNKEYTGTIQLTHPSVHVYKDVGTLKRSDETVEVVIDEKVDSAKDVKKLGINVGDFVSFDPRTIVTESGFIKSRHLDDKASAGILIGLAKYLKDNKIDLNRKIYLLFTTYEEVGHGGASGLPEDTVEMISVDMGAVGDDLETDETKVSICAKDSGGPYDYEITTKLIELADRLKLNYAIDIYPSYGSDVEASLSAGYDIKHGLIGPGVFASHGYERTHADGLKNTLELLISYIQS